MAEPLQAGIHYHTDTVGNRWRIHVRWEKLDRPRLMVEQRRLQEMLAEPIESDAQLRERGRQQVEGQRDGLRARLRKIAEELD